MHHQVFILIVVIASFQALAWVTRKYLVADKRLHINAIKLFESFIISGLLISYILYTTNIKDIKDSYKIMGWWHFFLMVVTGICVVVTVTLVFHLLRKIDVSVLQPTTSIARIVILSIVAIFLFNEKITPLKILALLLMISGIGLMMYTNNKN